MNRSPAGRWGFFVVGLFVRPYQRCMCAAHDVSPSLTCTPQPLRVSSGSKPWPNAFHAAMASWRAATPERPPARHRRKGGGRRGHHRLRFVPRSSQWAWGRAGPRGPRCHRDRPCGRPGPTDWPIGPSRLGRLSSRPMVGWQSRSPAPRRRRNPMSSMAPHSFRPRIRRVGGCWLEWMMDWTLTAGSLGKGRRVRVEGGRRVASPTGRGGGGSPGAAR